MNARRLFYTAGRLDSDVPHQKGFFFMIYFFLLQNKCSYDPPSFMLRVKAVVSSSALISKSALMNSHVDVNFSVCKERLCLCPVKDRWSAAEQEQQQEALQHTLKHTHVHSLTRRKNFTPRHGGRAPEAFHLHRAQQHDLHHITPRLALGGISDVYERRAHCNVRRVRRSRFTRLSSWIL